METESYIEILLDSARGVYIPANFVKCYNPSAWHVSQYDAQVLMQDMEDPEYWDSWENVLDTAYFIDKAGNKWLLYQDGDLFAYREDIPETMLDDLIGA